MALGRQVCLRAGVCLRGEARPPIVERLAVIPLRCAMGLRLAGTVRLGLVRPGLWWLGMERSGTRLAWLGTRSLWCLT
jgi:hypothetical protein